jgi:hypothetical protein
MPFPLRRKYMLCCFFQPGLSNGEIERREVKQVSPKQHTGIIRNAACRLILTTSVVRHGKGPKRRLSNNLSMLVEDTYRLHPVSILLPVSVWMKFWTPWGILNGQTSCHQYSLPKYLAPCLASNS